MLSTKYDAVEYFNFLRKNCAKNGCEDCEYRCCGVTFYKEYAYSLTGDVVGRIKVCDNLPIASPIFWSYDREGETDRLTQDKFMLNVRGYIRENPGMEHLFEHEFFHSLDRFIARHTENDFLIRKSDVLDILKGKELSQAKQKKIKIQLTLNADGVSFHTEAIKFTKAMSERDDFFIPFFVNYNTYHKVRIQLEDNCTVNLSSFYDVLEFGFADYDVLRIKFRSSEPIIISGKANNKDEITFALTQIC